jgi:hypothetical protein
MFVIATVPRTSKTVTSSSSKSYVIPRWIMISDHRGWSCARCLHVSRSMGTVKPRGGGELECGAVCWPCGRHHSSRSGNGHHSERRKELQNVLDLRSKSDIVVTNGMLRPSKEAIWLVRRCNNGRGELISSVPESRSVAVTMSKGQIIAEPSVSGLTGVGTETLNGYAGHKDWR